MVNFKINKRNFCSKNRHWYIECHISWQTIGNYFFYHKPVPYKFMYLVVIFKSQNKASNLITFSTDYFFHHPSSSLTTWTRYPYIVNGFIYFMESMHIYVKICNDTEADWKFTTHQACYKHSLWVKAQGNSL